MELFVLKMICVVLLMTFVCDLGVDAYGRYHSAKFKIRDNPSHATSRTSKSAPVINGGLRCHDCATTQCEQLIRYNRTGQCSVQNTGTCFIRRDPNNIIYRGCADQQKWPLLDFRYNGCRYQRYGWWDDVPVLWCFCDFDLCNVNISYVLNHYNQQSPPKPTTTPGEHHTQRNIDIYRWLKFKKYLKSLIGRPHYTTRPITTTAVTPRPTTTTPYYYNVTDRPALGCGALQCHHRCEVVNGVARCRCQKGFILTEDHRTCADKDECLAGYNVCSQKCTNIPGSYYCSCNSGYVLSQDRYSCRDVDECRSGVAACDQGCQNTPGSYRCTCYSGFTINADQVTCSDVDECVSSVARCSQLCTNTVGSYTCSCRPGYTLHLNGYDCNSVSPCSANNNRCEQICRPLGSGYKCDCNQGYILDADGFSCSDLDECYDNNGGCQHLCFNTPGSFYCQCSPGYTLNPDTFSCSDVDECVSSVARCSQLCTNTVGSYTCSCRSGYTLDINGYDCNSVSSCSANNNNNGCEQICRSLGSGFECDCHQGYILDADGFSCSDLDECYDNNGGCQHLCYNTPGSFYCQCSPGYSLNTDTFSCSVQCPDDLLPTHWGSCYRIYTNDNQARSVAAAQAQCASHHPATRLVTVDTNSEHLFLANLLATQTKLLDGWQGWWTGGRYNMTTGQFHWPDLTVIPMNSTRWGFLRAPYEDTCVWVLQNPFFEQRWGNYDCETQSGFICELVASDIA